MNVCTSTFGMKLAASCFRRSAKETAAKLLWENAKARTAAMNIFFHFVLLVFISHKIIDTFIVIKSF